MEFHGSSSDATLTAIVNETVVDGTLWSGATGVTQSVTPAPQGAILPTKETVKVTADIQSLGQFEDVAFEVGTTAGVLSLRSVIVTGWIDTIDTARS